MSAFQASADRVAGGADHQAEAEAIVAQMTLGEKLGCLDGDTAFWPGLFDMTSGGYYQHAWPAAAVPRLGVPGIHFADGPRGCVVGDATAFPVSMARGATFDPQLEERVGAAIGAELRASGATFTGAVCMNLLRHPAWGRAQETYGEDPHHVGVMAQSLTRGLQRHVMACMKHFALNSMENARFSVDVQVDERALHEVYLPHFERVAGEGVASVMSAYNSVNGEWCGDNETLLTTILRDQWGWDGFVVSDFIFGLRDAAKSVRAGLDIEMPFRQQRAMRLDDALAAGELTEADVDVSVTRIVATLLRFAQVFQAQPATDVIGSDDHRALAHEAAVASTVLLRNHEHLLPVDPAGVSRIAVLGRLARVKNLGDGGSSDVRSTRVITPLDGIRARFPDADVVHSDDDTSIATDADLVVIVVGYTKDDEGEYIDNDGTGALIADLFPPMDHPELGVGPPLAPVVEDSAALVSPDDPGMAPGGDRDSLRLSSSDESLIAQAAALNDRTVVSVVAGSAVMMPWADQVSSILMSWYSGVEGGTALADILAGDAEPAGRLPFAVPTDADHLPLFDKDAVTATYDLFHGQWVLDRDGVAAQFPFGFGLGYSDIVVDSADWIGAGAGVEVSVTNTGERDGSTVVFAHGGADDSDFVRPARRLIGFVRIAVPGGMSVTASIDLDWAMTDLRLDGAWLTEATNYTVEVGQHAHDDAAILLNAPRS